MDSLHKVLHELNDNLIDIRSVIKASDESLTIQFKRHMTLLQNTSEKVNSIQSRIDKLMEKPQRVDVHKSDNGAWPT